MVAKLSVPCEGVRHTEFNTRVFWDDDELGNGTLYITESVLCWISSEGSGFSLKYPSIFIHAVSADANNFPEPCLYLKIDGKIALDDAADVSNGDLVEAVEDMGLSCEEGESDDEDDVIESKELRFVPENSAMLDVMFRALSECQALNPSPNEHANGGFDQAMLLPSFPIIPYNGDKDPLEEGQ